MRWTRGERSGNLEDRRGQSGGFGRGPMRMGGGGIGLGGLLLMLGIAWLLGINPLSLLGAMQGGVGDSVSMPGSLPGETSGPVQSTPAEEERVDFVSFVLDDVQSTWKQQLNGYTDARLVLFREQVMSGCGGASGAMGPFYCPADQKVYVDLGFFDELANRFGAAGDFAQAYVLAHEIGHHVQSQLGTEKQLRDAQRANPGAANALSVRMELQADCYAGVWAHSTQRRDLLEQGDLQEGLAAASAVGDDRIQEMQTGQVHPESFTHGSSQQREAWFRRGFDTGDPRACDTFASSE
jgi:predicted metalloprotease